MSKMLIYFTGTVIDTNQVFVAFIDIHQGFFALQTLDTLNTIRRPDFNLLQTTLTEQTTSLLASSATTALINHNIMITLELHAI